MDEAWQLLHRAGLPLAGARSGPAPAPGAMAAAVRLLVASEASSRERKALAAFVLAWSDQWPRSFQASFSGDAATMVEWAERTATDANRRIKLRRIAMEHLAGVL